MSDRQLRSHGKKAKAQPPKSAEPPPETQAGPSGTTKQSKGKQPEKKRRRTESHSPTPAAQQSPAAPALEGSKAPNFHPIIPNVPAHKAFNRLPAELWRLKEVKPEAVFRLFLTNSLLETITKHTNEYAATKRGENPPAGGRAWWDVTSEEVGVWIGIVMYMGVHRSPAIADYWKHDDKNPLHPIRTHMSQTRFEQIKRYLHIESPSAPKEQKDPSTGKVTRFWHSKVDPILDQLRKSSQRYRTPSTNVAIDEAMIRCTGRSQDTYKMPSKPIEQGFKFHCLADHGYVWDFLPTSNQAGPDKVDPVPGLTATGEVVFHLLKKLPHGRHFVAYMDNFYTTIPLLGRLRHDLQIGGCGTARPKSKGFPTELYMAKADVTKHEYHSTKIKVIKDPVLTCNEEVGAMRWIDNAPVTMLTTVHDLSSTTMSLRMRPGAKSTNAKNARKFFGDENQKMLPIPTCFDDYNHHMGGVDIADQLHTYYDIQLVSARTWWPMFFWALQSMIINARIIYSDHPDAPELSHKEFRLRCAWALINAAVSIPSRSTRASTTTSRAGSSESGPVVTAATQLPLDRICASGCGHLPSLLEGGRLVCWLCRFKQRGEGHSSNLPKTRWVCGACEKPFCMTDQRNCFREFHTV
jgi:hypothetical protein